jgi:hypothetical protein
LPIKPVTRRTLSARATPSQIRAPIAVRQDTWAKPESTSPRPNPSLDISDENAVLVGRGLAVLRKGLAPHVEAQLRAKYGERWWEAGVEASLKDNFGGLAWREVGSSGAEGISALDIQALLQILWSQWFSVFRSKIGDVGRTYVYELRSVRNKWAHQHSFTLHEADYALGTMRKLLQLLSATEAHVVVALSQELREIHLKNVKLGQIKGELL